MWKHVAYASRCDFALYITRVKIEYMIVAQRHSSGIVVLLYSERQWLCYGAESGASYVMRLHKFKINVIFVSLIHVRLLHSPSKL